MYELNKELFFPPVTQANQDGIVTIGGDLSPERLLLAYKSGIFPWFEEGEPITWWSPNPRMVLFLEELIVSKSMRNVLNQNRFKVTFNENFRAVITTCQRIKRNNQNGTWITNEMIEAYCELNKLGHAKSVEVWQNNELVGGLYGVDLKSVFCGESMFSLVSNASKVAFITLYTLYNKAPFIGCTLASVLAGVSYVWQSKVLLGAMSLDLFAVLLGGATALLPIYARDILHTGPQGLGLLRAAPAVGALLMTLLLVRFPLQRHVGYKLLGAVAVFGLATLVFGLSSHFGLSLLALAVTGAADSISVVTRLTLMQLETPDAMRGRVSAVNSIFIGASNQLGEFESGATAALLGPVGSVVLGGLGTVLIAASWLRLFPALARRDRLS